jgi:hypothetical protein
MTGCPDAWMGQWRGFSLTGSSFINTFATLAGEKRLV